MPQNDIESQARALPDGIDKWLITIESHCFVLEQDSAEVLTRDLAGAIKHDCIDLRRQIAHALREAEQRVWKLVEEECTRRQVRAGSNAEGQDDIEFRVWIEVERSLQLFGTWCRQQAGREERG